MIMLYFYTLEKGVNSLCILKKLFNKLRSRSQQDIQIHFYSDYGLTAEEVHAFTYIIKHDIMAGISSQETAITLYRLTGQNVIINRKQNVIEVML